MPLTKTGDRHLSSKTEPGKRVQGQTPSESEAQTQKLQDKEKQMTPSPEVTVTKKADKPKKVGEVTITFFGKRHHEVKVTGEVAFSHIQRANRALYKAVSINKAKMRQARKARLAKKAKEE
jgi:hypothetical protein